MKGTDARKQRPVPPALRSLRNARAECVMLHKGPMIVAASATLDDILARMAPHRHKKTSLLRHLQAWSPKLHA